MDRAIILSYVYKHLTIYYDISELELNNLEINYSESGNPFFSTTKPHPENIHWKKHNEINLPLLFEQENEKDWFSIGQQSITFHYDLPSMIFYFMSGWQEEHCKIFDQYNRFPYSESIQKKLRIETSPIVCYYFSILQQGLSTILKREVLLKEKFNINITHDIDVLNSGWKAPIVTELKAFHFLKATTLLLNKVFKGKTTNQNIEEIIQFEQSKGLTSTFYFLPTNDIQKGIKNADYSLNEPYVKDVISLIKKSPGFKLGLHTPSINHLDTEKINQFNDQLGGEITTNRFHYLACRQKDLAIFENTSITEDSSLGFAENIGFRHSIAWPFHPFNFVTNIKMNVLEYPLNVMDVTLTNPQYMNLNNEEIEIHINKILKDTKHVNGTLSFLIHNNSFPSKLSKKIYETITKN